ncbi:hypothetical protein HYW99_02700 [Candidatus Woesearchaeota archaeon]|nr:hypothetical protein [Candidatus Woesearchaeota archaeon]
MLKLIERYKDGEEGKNGFNGYGSITIPIDFDKVTLGTKSAIYIFDEFFYDLVRFFPTLQNKKSEDTLITIVKNVIEKHEFVHARHFNRGIDEYPFEFFKYENGEINGGLFRIVSEILSLESEYNSLVEDERARFNPILMNYALKLKSKARRLYSLIFDNEGLTKDMGSEFITRLKNDLKPDKLFKATFFK